MLKYEHESRGLCADLSTTSPNTITAWRSRLGLTISGAAEQLGCARNSLAAYEAGRTPIPRYIALACAAIAQGIPPIK